MIAAAALTNDERGQDLIEYALLAGLVSPVAVLAVVNVGSGVKFLAATIIGVQDQLCTYAWGRGNHHVDMQ